jgi:hypothetical protein
MDSPTLLIAANHLDSYILPDDTTYKRCSLYIKPDNFFVSS